MILYYYQELWFVIHLLCMIVRIRRLDSGEPIVRSYRIGFILMVHHHLLLCLQMIQIPPTIHQAICQVSTTNSLVLEITNKLFLFLLMFVVLDSSGVTQVGQINLDIQLTVNSSYLKPRIEDLSKIFSKELDVKSSQVSQTDKHTTTCKP